MAVGTVTDSWFVEQGAAYSQKDCERGGKIPGQLNPRAWSGCTCPPTDASKKKQVMADGGDLARADFLNAYVRSLYGLGPREASPLILGLSALSKQCVEKKDFED